MTRNPTSGFADGTAPVSRRGEPAGDIPPDAAGTAGTPHPPVGVPAQTSRQAGLPTPSPDGTRAPSRAAQRGQAPRGGTLEEGAVSSPAGGEPPSTSSLPDRTTTWTIELPAGMPLPSLNDRDHWRTRHAKAQAVKNAAIVMARQAKLPRLRRVSVTAEYQPPDRRHRDGDNIAPAAKAAVDGLVVAGILAGDDKRYVTGTFCTIGEPYPKGRLVLRITEEAP